MRCVGGTNWAFVQLAIPPKVPPVTDLGFFERAPESRIEPSAQVDQKGHLRVYPRVWGFSEPVQGELHQG